jgi:transcriptional regulator with XRE-family HTH domain
MAKPRKSSGARPPTGDPVLGRNIREARKRAELNQEALASRCGVTKGLISQFEKGDTMPSVPVIMKIGEALGCGVDALLFGQGNRFHSNGPHTIDVRVKHLPDAMREFVLLWLARAEKAVALVPAQFLKIPTDATLPEFAAYLEALAATDKSSAKK